MWMCSCMHADNLEAKQLSLETKFKGSSECKKSCGACLACLPVCLLAAGWSFLPQIKRPASQHLVLGPSHRVREVSGNLPRGLCLFGGLILHSAEWNGRVNDEGVIERILKLQNCRFIYFVFLLSFFWCIQSCRLCSASSRTSRPKGCSKLV